MLSTDLSHDGAASPPHRVPVRFASVLAKRTIAP